MVRARAIRFLSSKALRRGLALAQLRAFLPLRVAGAAPGEAAEPFLFLADLAAAPLVRFGLADGDGVDAGTHRADGEGHDVDRGAGDAAAQQQRDKGEGNQAHGRSIAGQTRSCLNAEQDGVETWTRDFGGHRFASHLSERRGHVVERFGPIRFAFALPSGPEGLEMQLRRWSIFGMPLPLMLAPKIAAREWEEDGRFRFDVRVAMPLIGDVVHYTGRLSPVL